MITNELISYIKQAHKSGNAKTEIVKTLTEQGWESADIEEAYQKALSLPIAPSASKGSSDTTFLDVGDLIQQAIQIGKERYWHLLGITAFGWVISSVMVGILLLVVVLGGIGVGISGGSANPASMGIIITAVIVGIVAFIGFIILASWIQAAVIIGGLKYREKIGVFAAYREAWHAVGPYIITGLLSGLAVMGGFLFFVVPGIILSVWLFAWRYIVVSENKSGLEALVQARNYVRGRGFETFGRLVVLFAIQLGISLLTYVLSLFAGDDFQPIANNLLNSVITIALAPFFLMYMVRLYESLKATYKPSDDAGSGKGIIVSFIVLGIIMPAAIIIGLISLAKSLPADFYETFTETFEKEFNNNRDSDNYPIPPYTDQNEPFISPYPEERGEMLLPSPSQN